MLPPQKYECSDAFRWCSSNSIVMPGLVPGIHGKPADFVPRLVDDRDKPGHDGPSRVE